MTDSSGFPEGVSPHACTQSQACIPQEEAESAVRFTERPTRRAFRRQNLAESFLVAKYSISPYMACSHGCAYCDGRAERYFVEGDFARDVVVRVDVADRAAEELPKLRERGFVSLGSGITDAYQPAEARFQLSRRIGELLAAHRRGAVLLTKGDPTSSDMDVWLRVHERAHLICVATITTVDEGVRAHFEPGATPIAQRLQMLRAFSDAGCTVGVAAMPILPFIGDDAESMDRLYRAAENAGASFVMPGTLTLRPGRQKEHFLSVLAQRYPGLVARYREIYAEDRPSGSPTAAYRRQAEAVWSRIAATHTAAPGIPHRVVTGRVQLYDEVNILMLQLMERFEGHRASQTRLKCAYRRYVDAISARKAEYNRHGSRSFDELDEQLRRELGDGSFAKTIGNARLARFLHDATSHSFVFDVRLGRLVPFP